MNSECDVLIIGAGITGCAVAREMSRYYASVVVLDRENDVAEGATKANSGLVHAGYDAAPGSRKAFYNVRGAAMYPDICSELHIPYKKNGALVIALSESDRATVTKLYERGMENHVSGLEIIDHDTAISLEPSLNPDVICALYVPSGAIISPYETAFAFADDAAVNGVSFYFNQCVCAIARMHDGRFKVCTHNSEFLSKVIVNCAGAYGADIHNILSQTKIKMIHRKGQYYLLDRANILPFSMTIFQCPSPMGKGVLVSPTVHGNLLLGPTAEDIDNPSDTSTTAAGLQEILRKVSVTWPAMSVKTNITNFSGIRAHLTSDDFIVGQCQDCKGYFEAVGIESPGLSSAPAIGLDLAQEVADWLGLEKKKIIIPCPERPVPFSEMSPAQRDEAVQDNPAYGRIICRCETITEAEIRSAIRRPVGASTIDGIKRRTRAGMGRCQGGFCLPRVAEILSEKTGISMTQITKNGGKSYILSGTVDSFLKEGQNNE